MDDLVVLVHSPPVGPFTWSLVAQRRQAVGFDVLVPTLTDSGKTPPPYWQQHAASLQRVLASIHQERPLVFVGHVGAGCLLPALTQVAHPPVKAYLFVDAGLPHPGKTRLDEMETTVPKLAQELRQLLAEVQPRHLNFFEEVMPDVSGWSEAKSGYLLFTQGYRHYLEQAQRAGWPSPTLAAGHFHMLVDPVAVAATLVELMKM